MRGFASERERLELGRAELMATRDRRVGRTHRQLRAALVELVLERGWEGVRIQDLCDRADVGRSTFYKHFADKEDLLLGGYDALRAWAFARAEEADAQERFRYVTRLIEHAEGQRQICRAMVGKNTSEAVRAPFRELVVELLAKDLETLDASRPSSEATLHFLAGGFMGLLVWWLESASELSAAALAARFAEHAEAVVAAAVAMAPPRGP